MKNKFRTALLLTACISALSLTACGGTSSISTLTDSDSTTSIVGGNAVATDSVQTGDVSVTPTSSLPEIPAQVIASSDAATTSTAAADSTSQTADDASQADAETDADAGADAAVTSAAAQADADNTEIEEDDVDAAGEGNTATANTDDIRLRSEPSAESDATIIGYVEIGDTVTVLEAEGDWYRVEFNGQTGWVYAKYFD